MRSCLRNDFVVVVVIVVLVGDQELLDKKLVILRRLELWFCNGFVVVLEWSWSVIRVVLEFY